MANGSGRRMRTEGLIKALEYELKYRRRCLSLSSTASHRQLGKIVLSDDRVAADFTCARLMGLHRERVWHLDYAAHFVGTGAADRITLVAERLPERVVPFKGSPTVRVPAGAGSVALIEITEGST